MRVLWKALLGVAPLLVPSAVVAQTSIVSGRVVDARGEPVIGANVRAEGTTVGAAADLDGNYRFSIAPGTYRILVSAVGYAGQTRSVTLRAGETSTQNFTLADDVLNSEEIVVTGAGAATRRRELGIDVESVGGDLVSQRNTPAVSTALIGKVPGVQITESATPGAENLIILRGINSFGGGRPLLLIDGIQAPSDMLSTLDPNTVDRIEIVKGAAASTIYGAQGANGVIQVFLKKGRAGTQQVTVATSMAASNFVMGNFALADMHAYPTGADGSVTGLARDPASGLWSSVAQSAAPGSVTNKPYTLENFADRNLLGLYQTGLLSTASVSASGGSDRITYFGSYGYTNQRGIERETGQQKHAARLSVGAPLSSRLNVNIGLTLNNDTYRNETASGNSVLSGLGSVLNTPAWVNLQEQAPEGSPFRYRPQQYLQQTNNNPFFDKEYRDAETARTRLLGTIQLVYQPFRFLDLEANLGGTQTNTRFFNYQYNVQNLPYIAPILTPQGQADSRTTNIFDVTASASATLRSDLQRDFGLSFPVRSTTLFKVDYNRYDYRWIRTFGTGLPPIRSLHTLAALDTKNGDQVDERFVTYGGLINQKFDFGEYAGFEVGGRADQSSAFKAGEGIVFFPRANGYFRLVPFLSSEGQRSLSEAKFRLAYGSAGIQPGAYDRILTLSQGFIGSTAYLMTPGTVPNADLTVQRSDEFEAGLDFGYNVGAPFLSTVGLNATYWTRKSTDVLRPVPLAPSSGSDNILDNAFTFSARGLDLGLQTVWLSRSNFTWGTTFNFSKQATKIDDISGPLSELVLNATIPFLIREGGDVGEFYGFKAVRTLDEVNPATGQRLIAAANEGNYGIVNGRVVSVATQQVLFRPYRESLGSPTPDFVLTMRNDFTLWRDLTLGIQLDWNKGGQIYNATNQRMYQYNVSADNTVPVDIASSTGVRPTNPATGQPFTGAQAYAAYYNSIYKTSDLNEFFVEDGTYLKLREVSLSYQAGRLLQRMGLARASQATLTLSGRNLFTISNYKGFDPEVNQGGVNVGTRGFDYYTYPNFRTVTVGLSLTF